MSRFLFLVGIVPLTLAGGCVVADTTDFGPPEICGDGVDNSGNGLVDCDDPQCGGPACLNGGNGTNTTEPRADVEILFDAEQDCDFVFGDADCQNKQICTFRVINRTEVVGLLDSSCDNPNPDPYADNPLKFLSSQDGSPRDTLFNEEVRQGTTATVTMYSTCALRETYETSCRASIEAGNDRADLTWTIEAIWSE